MFEQKKLIFCKLVWLSISFGIDVAAPKKYRINNLRLFYLYYHRILPFFLWIFALLRIYNKNHVCYCLLFASILTVPYKIYNEKHIAFKWHESKLKIMLPLNRKSRSKWSHILGSKSSQPNNKHEKFYSINFIVLHLEVCFYPPWQS